MRMGGLILLALFLAGCGTERKSTPDTGTSSASPPLSSASFEEVLGAVRQPGARAVVLNVWATWCGPCREEFPDLIRMERDYRDRGLRMVLVSADFEDQQEEARQFLADQGVGFASFIKTGDDMAFIEALDPRWTGALPATFVYDGRGTLRHFQEGRTHYAALETLVVAAMSATDSLEKEASR